MSKQPLTGFVWLPFSIATLIGVLTISSTPDAQALAAAHGRVIDAVRAPVRAASVTAFAEDGTAVADARTSTDGSFEIRAPEGSYRLRISADRVTVADARVQ